MSSQQKDGVVCIVVRSMFVAPRFISASVLYLFCIALHAELDTRSSIDSERFDPLVAQMGEARSGHHYGKVLFGRYLSFGGEIGNTLKYSKDFTLANRDDDELALDGDIELEFYLQLSAGVSIFIEPTWSYRRDLYREDSDRENDTRFERGQSWVYLDRMAGSNFSLQLGRQEFKDEREWWWDENLDAIRMLYTTKPLHAELAIAKDLTKVSSNMDGIDPEQKDVIRALGSLTWRWTKRQQLALFVLYQSDRSRDFLDNQIVMNEQRDDVDADLTWLGVRASGVNKLGDEVNWFYWVDVARVDGSEDIVDFDGVANGLSMVDKTERFSVDAWGFDAGLTLQFDAFGKPTVTIGYAKGSGDSNYSDADNSAFQQTGLHANEVKLRGVNRFRYYGELLRPELSNIEIGTLGFGFSLLENSSVEIIYHHYRQVNATDFIRGDALREKPQGLSRDLGRAIDWVLGIEESKHWEWEIVASVFRAGDAFQDEGELVYKLRASVDYNF